MHFELNTRVEPVTITNPETGEIQESRDIVVMVMHVNDKIANTGYPLDLFTDKDAVAQNLTVMLNGLLNHCFDALPADPNVIADAIVIVDANEVA